MTEELKNSNLDLNRLIDLFKQAIKCHDIYCLVKKINRFIGNKEMNSENELKYKSLLTLKLDQLIADKSNYDLMNIPLFLSTLKLIYTYKNTGDKKIKKQKNVEVLSKEDSLILFKNFISAVTLLKSLLKLYFEKTKDKKNINDMEIEGKYEIIIYSQLIFNVLSYILFNFEEFFMLSLDNQTFSSNSYFADIMIKSSIHLILVKIITIFPYTHLCAYPSFSILLKILNVKPEQKDIVYDYIKKSSDILQGIGIIFVYLYDHSKFLNVYLSFIITLMEKLEIKEILMILSFKAINIIFSQYKVNGFESIHDNFLTLIVNIILKKSTLSETEIKLYFHDQAYTEIIHLFSNSLILILKRLKLLDIEKICKWLSQCLSHINTISTIINSINPNNAKGIYELCNDRKLSECFIEIFYFIFDKSVFQKMHKLYNKRDINLISTKVILMRTLFHVLSLIKTLYDMNNSSLTKSSAKKLYKFIKYLKENDSSFNSTDISLEKVSL